MKLELIWMPATMQTAERILSSNRISARFGLALNREQAIALAQDRQKALEETGRVEFANGVLEDLIFAFCDSPYIDQAHYAETLDGLLRLFYAFKNETLDQLPDAELIEIMKTAFDGPPCYGSLALLEGKVLEEVGRRERFRGLPQAEEAGNADVEENEDA
ncbi:MAG: DUF6323 family protein [Candidatus Pelethousia sp.]|nr:DUF6323 family protein [Candidatus Pelethousia sp.]